MEHTEPRRVLGSQSSVVCEGRSSVCVAHEQAEGQLASVQEEPCMVKDMKSHIPFMTLRGQSFRLHA